MDKENPEYKSPVLINRTIGIAVNLNKDGTKNGLLNLEVYFHKKAESAYVSKQNETEIFKKIVELCEEYNVN